MEARLASGFDSLALILWLWLSVLLNFFVLIKMKVHWTPEPPAVSWSREQRASLFSVCGAPLMER